MLSNHNFSITVMGFFYDTLVNDIFHTRKIRLLLYIVTIVIFHQNVSSDTSTSTSTSTSIITSTEANIEPLNLCDSAVKNGQVIINCVKRNLDYIPLDLDVNVASLDVSYNNLREITRKTMRMYQKLVNFTFKFGQEKPKFPCRVEADAFLDLKLILLDIELGWFEFSDKPMFPQSLKILKLIGMKLNSSMLDLTNLKNLEELFVQNNVLIDMPLLYDMAPLRTLNLKDNPIGNIPPLYLARYCKLRTFVFEFQEDSLIYENYCVCTQLRDWIRLRNILGTKPTPPNCYQNMLTKAINCTPGITKSMQKAYYECLIFHQDPETRNNSYLIEFLVMGILLFLIAVFFTASVVIFFILGGEIVRPNGKSAGGKLRDDDDVTEEEES